MVSSAFLGESPGPDREGGCQALTWRNAYISVLDGTVVHADLVPAKSYPVLPHLQPGSSSFLEEPWAEDMSHTVLKPSSRTRN